ncbi:MAG: serine hydrolase domain-containing protein [Acidimicrobiales bacterium]
MADAPSIHGIVAEGFEPVRDAFERNFTEHGDVGAAVSVVVDGQVLVDLWGGSADRSGERPWTENTLVNVYSSTKGLTALCAHVLADRGVLDLDAPVVDVWPEFGAAGKSTMPIRYLLTHEAGLPVIDENLPDGAVVDWEHMVGALERQAPVWEPGSAQGYHAVTFGWLVGEVVRRATGVDTFGEALDQLVVAPLGIDFYVGTPDSEHHRVADLVRDTAAPPSPVDDAETDDAQRAALAEMVAAYLAPDSLVSRSLGLASKPFAPSNNSAEWRRAQVPAANGHGNARSLARVYGALAGGGEIDGVRLLSPEAVDRASALQVGGRDRVLPMETRRSLGFMLPVPGQPDRRGPRSFGHAGAGGSLGYADPDRALGFGYTMNTMWGGGFMAPDPRAQGLIGAVHAALDARA